MKKQIPEEIEVLITKFAYGKTKLEEDEALRQWIDSEDINKKVFLQEVSKVNEIKNFSQVFKK